MGLMAEREWNVGSYVTYGMLKYTKKYVIVKSTVSFVMGKTKC